MKVGNLNLNSIPKDGYTLMQFPDYLSKKYPDAAASEFVNESLASTLITFEFAEKIDADKEACPNLEELLNGRYVPVVSVDHYGYAEGAPFMFSTQSQKNVLYKDILEDLQCEAFQTSFHDGTYRLDVTDISADDFKRLIDNRIEQADETARKQQRRADRRKEDAER